MLERDRLSIRAYREEEEARERAEQEERERPIREAEAAMNSTYRELAKVVRARLHGEVKDPDLYLDPEVAAAKMSKEQANAFNAEQFNKFYHAHPELAAQLGTGPELEKTLEIVAHYWTVNKIAIATERMFWNVIQRMHETGMLPGPPQPEPEPEPTPEPEPAKPAGPKVYVGRDWETGEEKTFTQREVNRMSSLDFKRAFEVAPTIRDLFIAMNDQREQA